MLIRLELAIVYNAIIQYAVAIDTLKINNLCPKEQRL